MIDDELKTVAASDLIACFLASCIVDYISIKGCVGILDIHSSRLVMLKAVYIRVIPKAVYVHTRVYVRNGREYVQV